MSFNPDRINIKDLTIEEPEQKQEVFFNPETYITDKDWNDVKNSLEERIKKSDILEFASIVADIKIISPDTNIDVDWELFENKLEDLRGKGEWEELSRLMASMKLLNSDYKIDSDQKTWDGVLGLLKDPKIRASDFCRQVERIKILKPTSRFDSDIKKKFFDVLKDTNKDRGYASVMFAYQAERIRIVFPEEKILLDDFMMEKIIDHLRKDKDKKEWHNFFSLARAIKVLTVERVEVTSNGLEITMIGNLSALKSPSIPEVRNF